VVVITTIKTAVTPSICQIDEFDVDASRNEVENGFGCGGKQFGGSSTTAPMTSQR